MQIWETKEISELGEVVGGATPSTAVDEYYNGSIPWITPKDMSAIQGRFIMRGERNITKSGLDSCSTRLMPRGSVLFTSRAPIGYIGISQTALCTNQGFKSIIPNERTDSMFLYYLLKYSKDNIEATASGTTFKEVSGRTMRQIKVRVPKEISVQRSIAATLSCLDDKIELNNRIIANLEAQAQAIFKSWFVDFEPWAGTRPASWKDGCVGDMANAIYSGGTPDTRKPEYWGGDIPWLSSGETRNHFVTATEKSITKAGVDQSSTRLAKRYSVVMASAGQGYTRGQTSLLLIDTYVNQSIVVIESSASAVYIYLSLSGRYEELRGISDSSSIRGSITTKMISSFPLTVPDKPIIEEFSSLIMPLFNLIENCLYEIQNLARTRDSLLPKLMSGEIEVPVEG